MRREYEIKLWTLSSLSRQASYLAVPLHSHRTPTHHMPTRWSSRSSTPINRVDVGRGRLDAFPRKLNHQTLKSRRNQYKRRGFALLCLRGSWWYNYIEKFPVALSPFQVFLVRTRGLAHSPEQQHDNCWRLHLCPTPCTNIRPVFTDATTHMLVSVW